MTLPAHLGVHHPHLGLLLVVVTLRRALVVLVVLLLLILVHHFLTWSKIPCWLLDIHI